MNFYEYFSQPRKCALLLHPPLDKGSTKKEMKIQHREPGESDSYKDIPTSNIFLMIPTCAIPLQEIEKLKNMVK